MDKKRVLAIDLGGSSGRVMLGEFSDGTMKMTQLHRFSNDPVEVQGTLYWDILRLFHEIKIGIAKSREYGSIESLSIDTWGVDFGLFGINGELIANPVHYRDKRTIGMLDAALQKVTAEQLYDMTGNQFMEINTAFQLLALKKRQPELLSCAWKFLTIPALLSYFLGGKPVVEESMASTTQLYDQRQKRWAWELIERLELPASIFPEIVKSGTVIGRLSKEIAEELGVNQLKLIAGCSHDTQSAQLAVPTDVDDFLFISCGTWSLVGTETKNPVLTNAARTENLTNETAFAGRYSFMKNVIGLWLIQESRRQWEREGLFYSYAELEALAAREKSMQSYINPDDPVFASPGNIPVRIQEFCKRTGQAVPETVGQIVRCIDESLARRYAQVKLEIEKCTGVEYQKIFIVGGGAQSSLLCQLTANYCKVPVMAGPLEATVYGNLAIQFLATGDISDVKQIRKMIRELDEIKEYLPEK